MSATQTSSSTDSKNWTPITRACATASQASQSTTRPPSKRSAFGILGQPTTPLRRSQPPANTQPAPAAAQRRARDFSSRPPYQDKPQASTHAAASAIEPSGPSAFNRPHSQAPAAISSSATVQKGVGVL